MQTDHELPRPLHATEVEPPNYSKTTAADVDRLLYTPAAAAERLMIGESWLRKAGQRLVPCTPFQERVSVRRHDSLPIQSGLRRAREFARLDLLPRRTPYQRRALHPGAQQAVDTPS